MENLHQMVTNEKLLAKYDASLENIFQQLQRMSAIEDLKFKINLLIPLQR